MLEIKKLWKPKFGDRYYSMGITDTTIPYMTVYTWEDCIVDYARLKLGLIYRTEKEANAHMAEDYEKLTGKNLQKYLEWLQEEAKKYV